ncbi:MAG: pseudouridine synthase [Pseudomonadota bacterium]
MTDDKNERGVLAPDTEILEIELRAERAQPVVELLSEATGLSKTRVKDAMRKGAVWLRRPGAGTRAKRLRRASSVLARGEIVALNYNPAILAATAPQPDLVADHDAYSVWFKPAGLMSSGSRFGDHHAIVRVVEQRLDRASFIVHRLDRATRGLMVLAHRRKAAAALAAQFRDRAVRKIYQAEVAGRLDAPLTLIAPVDGKRARSRVTPHRFDARWSLVTVELETGRRHQIRAQLAAIGHPVLGDRLYGPGEPAQDLRLVAVELEFTCPDSGKPARFRIDATRALFDPETAI